MVENALPCPVLYTVRSALGPDAPPRPHVSGSQLSRERGGVMGPGETGLAVGAQEPVYDVDLGPGRSVWIGARIPCKGFHAWSSWAVLRLPPPAEVEGDGAGTGPAEARGPEQLDWVGTDPRLKAAKGGAPVTVMW